MPRSFIQITGRETASFPRARLQTKAPHRAVGSPVDQYPDFPGLGQFKTQLGRLAGEQGFIATLGFLGLSVSQDGQYESF